MKVLIVKTSSMGDVIHTLPALTDAARAIPGIEFDWVVEENFREIPLWHSSVGEVIPVAIRRWRKNLLQTWRGGEWQRYRQQLQRTEYDAVIDAQGLLKSALLATRLAKGPSFGLDKSSAREPLAARFYDHPIPVAKNQHAVERVRQLFAAALGYPLPAERGDFSIRHHFVDAEQAHSPYLVFQHSTTRFDKHWPEPYWQQLIKIAGDAGWKIKLPWGNANEQQRAERLAQSHPNCEVLPRLSLNQVAAVLAHAQACVSVDTGLSHLAAALDIPNIILFGPTDPGLVGGYGKDQVCLKAADYPAAESNVEPEIFRNLTPEIVFAQLKAHL
ncbi:lipopolysaccharide heptosyltransferase RfaC [Neptuniibacter halophilus]|uniref:lipopolysaccharide heptosyltransferase RfaC n=1 Tax=Neptuniibacter halophilus TaxID=651666 RepID=UPI002572D983|nr:lipopolysaccharide heptosyltransferase RfaC [Neptuniibacter halophilus]